MLSMRPCNANMMKDCKHFKRWKVCCKASPYVWHCHQPWEGLCLARSLSMRHKQKVVRSLWNYKGHNHIPLPFKGLAHATLSPHLIQDWEREEPQKWPTNTQKDPQKKKYLKIKGSMSTNEAQAPPRGFMKKINEIENPSAFNVHETIDTKRMIKKVLEHKKLFFASKDQLEKESLSLRPSWRSHCQKNSRCPKWMHTRAMATLTTILKLWIPHGAT